MLRFKLFDENHRNKEYSIDLNFKDDNEYIDWMASEPSFDAFMKKMETSRAPWAGVHDGTGGNDKDGVEYFGFSSYEIKDFDTAISMWEDFFRKHGKLIENTGHKLVKESLYENL